jgi:hypothetical protein
MMVETKMGRDSLWKLAVHGDGTEVVCCQQIGVRSGVLHRMPHVPLPDASDGRFQGPAVLRAEYERYGSLVVTRKRSLTG